MLSIKEFFSKTDNLIEEEKRGQISIFLVQSISFLLLLIVLIRNFDSLYLAQKPLGFIIFLNALGSFFISLNSLMRFKRFDVNISLIHLKQIKLNTNRDLIIFVSLPYFALTTWLIGDKSYSTVFLLVAIYLFAVYWLRQDWKKFRQEIAN